MSNINPFQPIKSLFEINFNCHGAFFAFRGCHGVDDLLGNNDVVTSFPTWDKAGLEGVYEVSKMRFQSAH